MQRRSSSLAVLFVLALLAGACAPQVAPAPTAAPTVAAATAVPVTGGSSSSAAMPSGPAQVAVASNAKFGSILVDSKGMTLYLFTTDKPNTSNCYGKCASFWPPLLTSGAPMAGAGLDASKLGTTKRTDGTEQVTYNSWPLYYFAKDKQPGDTNGQKIQGTWFVVSPSGDAIQQ